MLDQISAIFSLTWEEEKKHEHLDKMNELWIKEVFHVTDKSENQSRFFSRAFLGNRITRLVEWVVHIFSGNNVWPW